MRFTRDVVDSRFLRGGCLPHVKARNAARRGAEVLYILDGQVSRLP